MIKDGEYLFASSYLRAADKNGSPAQRLNRIADSGSAAALCANASAFFGVKNTEIPEQIFDAAMTKAVNKVRGAVPDFSVFRPLLYKYDCTNVKLAIKCVIRGLDPEGMLFGCGAVDSGKIVEAVQKSDFSCLPPEMSRAAAQAREAFVKTGEARCIDLLLDRACFADMSAEAEANGVELIIKTVKMRADAANVLTAARIKASGMQTETAVSLLERSLVPGGGIPCCAFCGTEGIRSVAQIGAQADGSPLCGAVKAAGELAGDDFSAMEKSFDEAVLAMCSNVKYKAFGPEIAAAYLLVREAEIMNCRIVAAGLAGGMTADEIRERTRRAYV